ncbi:hypothetical protein X975_09237, partial [Stegodyphus mimosarum]
TFATVKVDNKIVHTSSTSHATPISFAEECSQTSHP